MHLVIEDRKGNEVELDVSQIAALTQGISSMSIQHPEVPQERQTDRKQHANQANSNAFLTTANAHFIKERENILNASANTRTLADEAYNIRKNRNEESYHEGRTRATQILGDHIVHMGMLNNATHQGVLNSEQVTSAGEESIRKALEVGLAASIKAIQEMEKTPKPKVG